MIGVTLAACEAPGSVRTTHTVTDSASVRIVENRIAEWEPGQEWRVSAEPVLRVGGNTASDASQFFRIRGVDFTADGGFVVLDGASSELRRYDARGLHQWSAGREGEGPGEFRQPAYIGQHEGEFLIWDRSVARLTLIGPAGELVGTESHVSASGEVPNAYGVFADGSLLVVFPRAISPPRPNSLLADTVALWRYERNAHERRHLVTLPGPTWLWTGRYQLPVPFTQNSLRGIAGDDLIVVSGAAPVIVVHGSDGALSARFVLPRGAEPVRPDDARRLVDFWIENEYYGAPASVWHESLERMPVPAERPAFDRLVVSRSGEIWARRFVAEPADGSPLWDVLRADGVYLGAVASPPGFEIMAIDGRRMIGIHRDADGVESIHIYEASEATVSDEG